MKKDPFVFLEHIIESIGRIDNSIGNMTKK
jgi:uncharacterized protein with HEPN domain